MIHFFAGEQLDIFPLSPYPLHTGRITEWNQFWVLLIWSGGVCWHSYCFCVHKNTRPRLPSESKNTSQCPRKGKLWHSTSPHKRKRHGMKKVIIPGGFCCTLYISWIPGHSWYTYCIKCPHLFPFYHSKPLWDQQLVWLPLHNGNKDATVVLWGAPGSMCWGPQTPCWDRLGRGHSLWSCFQMFPLIGRNMLDAVSKEDPPNHSRSQNSISPGRTVRGVDNIGRHISHVLKLIRTQQYARELLRDG